MPQPVVEIKPVAPVKLQLAAKPKPEPKPIV
jgi:hypothetical protein